MVYALWDTETQNLVAEYEHLDEALGLVLRGIERNGSEDPDSLALEHEDGQGEITIIARGQDLATLARQELSRNNRLTR